MLDGSPKRREIFQPPWGSLHHYTAKHAVTRVGCLQGLSSPTSFISPIKRRDSYDGGQIEYLEYMEMGSPAGSGPGSRYPKHCPPWISPTASKARRKGDWIDCTLVRLSDFMQENPQRFTDGHSGRHGWRRGKLEVELYC